MKFAVFITALLFTSLTVNVMTYLPMQERANRVQIASYTPPAIDMNVVARTLDKARGAK